MYKIQREVVNAYYIMYNMYYYITLLSNTYNIKKN